MTPLLTPVDASVAFDSISVQIHLQVCVYSVSRVRVTVRKASVLAVIIPALQPCIVTLLCAYFVVCVLCVEYSTMFLSAIHIISSCPLAAVRPIVSCCEGKHALDLFTLSHPLQAAATSAISAQEHLHHKQIWCPAPSD